MDLFEDKLSSPSIKWENEEKTKILFKNHSYSLPLILTENQEIELFSENSIQVFLQSYDLNSLDLVVICQRGSIDCEQYTQCQKICFLNNCGFEWISKTQAVQTIQVLLEDRRRFLAIISS